MSPRDASPRGGRARQTGRWARAGSPPPAAPSTARTTLLVALALGLAVGIAYATSFSAGFTLDSEFIIRRAGRVHALTWANLVDIFSTDYWAPGNAKGLYRPLATLSYLINWTLLGSGERAAGYHAVNLLLQWTNSFLVYALCRRALALAAPTAFFAALLFAVHPVSTEVVTNIVGRADLLAGTAVFGGLLLYLRADGAAGWRRAAGLAGVALVQFAGLLCKESAIALSGAIVLHDLLLRRRDPTESAAGGFPAFGRFCLDRFLRGWIVLVPSLGAVAALRARVAARTLPTEVDFAQNPMVVAGALTACLTALGVVGRSLWLLLWPAQLCPDYSATAVPLFDGDPRSSATLWALASIVLIALAAAVALRASRRAPALSFLIAFYAVAALPTANLLFLTGGVMAERFLYLPLFGFCGCLVLAVERLAAAIEPRFAVDRRRLAAGALAALALAWAARTARRNLDWRDDVTLWSDAVQSCPGTYRSFEGLAGALAAALERGDARGGDIDRVIALQEQALAILERDAPAGVVLPSETRERLGSYYLSKAILTAAPEAIPGGSGGNGAPSTAWAAKAAGQLALAAEIVGGENERRRALVARGTEVQEVGTPALYNDLGVARLYAGEVESSLAAFERARALAPWDGEAPQNSAVALLRLGRGSESLVESLQAFLLEPRREGLGDVLVAAYQQADPGGCGVTSAAGGIELHDDCPALRAAACAASGRLARSLESSHAGDPEMRAERAAGVRSNAERRYRCSALLPSPRDAATREHG